MGRVKLYSFLLVLLVTVPAMVGGAGLAAFLLRRAGYAPLVWGLLPLLALLLITCCLGVVLGRAASGAPPDDAGGSDGPEGPREGPPRQGPRGDDV